MKGLIQRVSSAGVRVDDEVVGAVGHGLLLLLGVEKDDDEDRMQRLVQKVLGYRVFPDEKGRMNLSLLDIRGSLLVVPQFTLAADTRKGMRPSFSSSAPPEQAEALFRGFVAAARHEVTEAGAGLEHVASGVFGADMQVSLVNDGPVTFLLEV